MDRIAQSTIRPVVLWTLVTSHVWQHNAAKESKAARPTFRLVVTLTHVTAMSV
jgi:hypothetical protein